MQNKHFFNKFQIIFDFTLFNLYYRTYISVLL